MKTSLNDFVTSILQELLETLHSDLIDGSIKSFTAAENGNKSAITLLLEIEGVTWDVKVMKSTQAS